MSKQNIHILIFTLFALGLPIWAMENNVFRQDSVHGCVGECYEDWKQETGGVLAVATAKAQERATASPAELGQTAYAGCIACHGARGEGGVGPALAGQSGQEINNKLVQYKNGETRGAQSALMWSQSETLSDEDMNNLAAFIETL